MRGIFQEKFMKKVMLAALMICGSIALAGCNTVAGFGADLKKGADHVGTALENVGSKGHKTQAPKSGRASQPAPMDAPEK